MSKHALKGATRHSLLIHSGESGCGMHADPVIKQNASRVTIVPRGELLIKYAAGEETGSGA